MIDIEHKTLEILKYNINNLEALLQDEAEIKRAIFRNISLIDRWTCEAKRQKYLEIALEILKSDNINEIMSILTNYCMKRKRKYDEINMFIGVISDFLTFFNKIYDIYLLDQILYVLKEFNTISMPNFKTAFKTNSYYESIHFSLDFTQLTLIDQDNDYIIKAFCLIQNWYKKQIQALLQNSNIKKAIPLIRERLHQECFNDLTNYYAQRLYIAFETQMSYSPAKKRVRIRPEDSAQITFFG